MELPPYRLPTLRSTAIHMWEKGVVFIEKIWKVVLAGSILIWFLGNFPINIEYSKNYAREVKNIETRFSASSAENNKEKATLLEALENQERAEHQEKTYIGKIGKFIEPAFEPLGFNWKNSVALVCGLIAKEIVVSTHGVLFKMGSDAETENPNLVNAIRKSHMTPLSAYGFMIFTLLYTPCLATIGIIKRETESWKWTSFSIVYSLSTAWILAFAIYQGGALIGLK